jgi:hypothetical protein
MEQRGNLGWVEPPRLRVMAHDGQRVEKRLIASSFITAYCQMPIPRSEAYRPLGYKKARQSRGLRLQHDIRQEGRPLVDAK